MLGRGALANPGLVHRVAQELGINSQQPKLGMIDASNWLARLKRLVDWIAWFHELAPERTLPRLKQWLRLASVHGSFVHFDEVKRAGNIHELFAKLRTVSSDVDG
jgi:tRNA-dihydrouridine synthase